MSKNQEDKIKQLQLYEQNIQVLGMQKQRFQSQLIEISSALSELEGTDESYKIIGNIMVKTPKDSLIKELEEKKEIAGIRLKSIEKQEDNIREKMKSLQEEVMKGMSGKDE